MLSDKDVESIKALVGIVDVSEVQTNPNIFNEKVELAIGKILEHYQLTYKPIAMAWEINKPMALSLVLVAREVKREEEK